MLGQGSVASLGWLAIALPLQIALTLGLGLLLASLHVFLRDIAQALGLVFSAWFYFTPIVYPLARVPESFRGAIELNPLTALVDLYRSALLGGSPTATRGFFALVAARRRPARRRHRRVSPAEPRVRRRVVSGPPPAVG